MSGVDPFDVEGRVGLGIPLGLGIPEDGGKFIVVIGHARQNVIAGTVQDAENAAEIIGAEVLLDGRDDRDPPSDRGLEQNLHPFFNGRPDDFLAMEGQQRLVGRDHMFTVFDGLENKGAGRFIAPDQFDDHIDLGIGQDLLRAGGQQIFLDRHASVGGDIQIRDPGELQGRSQSRFDELSIFSKSVDNPGTDGPEAEQTNVDLFHSLPL